MKTDNQKEKILFCSDILRARIFGRFGSCKTFAKEMGMTEIRLYRKLCNEDYFTYSEILRIVELLEIPKEKASKYFFIQISVQL